MIPKKFFLSMFLLFPVIVFAQDSLGFKPSLYAHFNPLSFIDFLDGNLSVGAEYRFHPHWSAGLDAGYIFYSDYVKNKGVSGYILRPFARIYPNKKQNSFLQFEFHLKQVNYAQENWLEHFENGQYVFQELKRYNWKKTVYGFHVLYGGKLFLSRDKKFQAELFCGLGIRWRNQGSAESNNPGATTIFNFDVPSQKSFIPAFPAGFRLVYRIK